MGQHYVPREYLRAFQAPERPDHVWMLARGEAKAKLLPIDAVAQGAGYYPDATERRLNREIEGPANLVLRKLRRSEMIDSAERLALARYIAALFKRVPRGRQRALDLVSETLDDTVDRFIAGMAEGVRMGVLSRESEAKGLHAAEQLRSEYKSSLPRGVLDGVLDPIPSDRVIEGVNALTWRVVVAPPGEYFITTDNPAFFHECYGVGTEKAELRFPLSPTHALHGTTDRNPSATHLFLHVGREWVREFNRSLASTTTRVAFSHRPSLWLRTLLERKNPYLFRLVWSV